MAEKKKKILQDTEALGTSFLEAKYLLMEIQFI